MFSYMLGDPNGNYFIQCFAAHPAAVHTAHVAVKPGFCHQPQAGARGCEHACRLPFLHHSGMCSMGSVTGLAEVSVSSVPTSG